MKTDEPQGLPVGMGKEDYSRLPSERLVELLLERDELLRFQKTAMGSSRRYAKHSERLLEDFMEALDTQEIPIGPNIGYVLVHAGHDGKIFRISKRLKESLGDTDDLLRKPWPYLIDRTTLGERYPVIIETLSQPIAQSAVLPVYSEKAQGVVAVSLYKNPLMIGNSPGRKVHVGSVLTIVDIQPDGDPEDYEVEGRIDAGDVRLAEILNSIEMFGSKTRKPKI